MNGQHRTLKLLARLVILQRFALAHGIAVLALILLFVGLASAQTDRRPQSPVDHGPFPRTAPPAPSVRAARPTPAVFPASDPRSLPLLTEAAIKATVTPTGTFTFDWPDGAGGDLSYGGRAIGVSEDGRFLYMSCNQDDKGIAKIEIPPLGGRARVVEPCRGPTRAEIAKIHPDPNAFRPMLGGVLELGGRIVVTGFISYDASGATTASHWGGPALSSLSAPTRGTVAPGFVKDHMEPIPPEWRALLGGDALSSAGYTSIISRASHGASVSSFTAADVGVRNPIPMTMLLGCPHSVPSCITYGTPTSNHFNGSELSGGFFIVPGTRTLAVIEREASGPTCYGYATRDPKMHGLDHPGPDDASWCYSLSDPLTDKGPKGYPYRLVAKLYDMAELVEVKQGTKNPWDIRQYATVDLPGSRPDEFVTSGAFSPTAGCYYLRRTQNGGISTVHVYCGWGTSSTPPPPPPTPTVTLTAVPPAIQEGQDTHLIGTSTNATRVTIDQGVGDAPNPGAFDLTVMPLDSTTYTATATGPGGAATATVLVSVAEPPPPPPPPPPTVLELRCVVDATGGLSCTSTGSTTLAPGTSILFTLAPPGGGQ